MEELTVAAVVEDLDVPGFGEDPQDPVHGAERDAVTGGVHPGVDGSGAEATRIY